MSCFEILYLVVRFRILQFELGTDARNQEFKTSKKQPVKITGRLTYVGLINYFLINFDFTV
ncbi:hypothetical protein J2780_001092 [Chryseobacterium camelliae]|nr:hypothetical protein [Chryseobacterium camelliae]